MSQIIQQALADARGLATSRTAQEAPGFSSDECSRNKERSFTTGYCRNSGASDLRPVLRPAITSKCDLFCSSNYKFFLGNSAMDRSGTIHRTAELSTFQQPQPQPPDAAAATVEDANIDEANKQ